LRLGNELVFITLGSVKSSSASKQVPTRTGPSVILRTAPTSQLPDHLVRRSRSPISSKSFGGVAGMVVSRLVEYKRGLRVAFATGKRDQLWGKGNSGRDRERSFVIPLQNEEG
jgi:hypothetical protein